VQRSISGIAQGIDDFGRLCILTDSGAEYVSGGDVSVRPQ
jgi:biotin-(acetyl-CoA carboxylase) ligase